MLRFVLITLLVLLAAIPVVLPAVIWSGTPESEAPLIQRDYFSLRERFRIQAKEYANAELTQHVIQAKGPKGEEISIDTLWIGSKSPSRAVLHISGTHGVEGYAGSAIQTALLEEGISVPEDSAAIFIHALNPWGMAHYRRFNEDNTDLNRNFLTNDSAFSGAPKAYETAEWFLNPERLPAKIDLFLPQALWLILKEGFTTLKQAIAGGQYNYPKGIYFGGNKLTESNSFLRDFVLSRLKGIEELYVVEIHTGLGSWAEDVLFWPYPEGHPKTSHLESLLAEGLSSDDPEEGVGFVTPGDLQNEVPKLIPQTEVYWVLQEFGAYGPVRTLRALKNENQYHHYSKEIDLNHWTKNQLVQAFNPAEKDWQFRVLARGKELGAKFIGILHEQDSP